VLGVAARLVPIKGVCLALHALKQIQTLGIAARLEIAGTGPDTAALQQLAHELGIASDVYFHGLVADMARFYQGVQILLHAPLREPFGNVSIEAAAHGCVVIVPRVDGLFETVDEGRTGFRLPATLPLTDYPHYGGSVKDIPEQVYDPDLDALRAPHFVDPSHLAAAVAELASDPARYAQMSAAAIAHVRAHFDPDCAVRKLIAAVLAAH
jgi:glycosyltransferase involved in cell wall biosynthesis